MRDIVIFTRQFATMINSGLPLVQSLDILAEQTENQALRKTIGEVLYDVESGNTLADAMGKHPKVFTELYVNMVAAGEAGGILDTILLRLATFLEKNDALVRKIKGAMIYPAVIFSVAGAAIVILLIFVIPTFQTMFESAGIPLPSRPRSSSACRRSCRPGGGRWARVIVGAGGRSEAVYARHHGGQLVIDRMMLAMPILGDLQRKAAVARFTRTLGTLVSSGVSILEGLEITAKTAGNRVIHDAVMGSRASIAGGETIAARSRSRASSRRWSCR
jgi:type IV pilus assembly protein PilC